jgi:hypothetical protein
MYLQHILAYEAHRYEVLVDDVTLREMCPVSPRDDLRRKSFFIISNIS